MRFQILTSTSGNGVSVIVAISKNIVQIATVALLILKASFIVNDFLLVLSIRCKVKLANFVTVSRDLDLAEPWLNFEGGLFIYVHSSTYEMADWILVVGFISVSAVKAIHEILEKQLLHVGSEWLLQFKIII